MENSKVIFYTTGCPRCSVLKTKLDECGVDYLTVEDGDLMIAKGFKESPMLEVDGTALNFVEALNWLME